MIQCTYSTACGKKCNNKCLKTSNFCHIKSHNNDLDELDKILKLIIDNFNSKSIPILKYDILDVDSDGSCLYKSLLHFVLINYYDFLEEINKDEAKTVFIDFDHELKKILHEEDSLVILSKIKNCEISQEEEDELAKNIQIMLKNYCYLYSEEDIKDMGISLGTLVLMTHDEEIDSLEEYNEVFEIFAGDPDYIEIESEEVYKSGIKKGKKKMIKKGIPSRWGGTPELYAFGKLFNVNVNVHVLKKIAKTSARIMNATERSKTARFLKYSSFDNNSKLTVDLVISETNSPHYRLMIAK